MAANIMMRASASLISNTWRYGYESIFFPMYDYNQDLSTCNTNLECESRYKDNIEYPDTVIVSNHSIELYNGYY